MCHPNRGLGMALGMAYNGAAGATRDSMQRTLELQGMSLQEVNEAYQSLIQLLQGLDPTVDFLLANSIWYRQGITVAAVFLQNMRTYFGAEIQGLDFSAQDAAGVINEYQEDIWDEVYSDQKVYLQPYDIRQQYYMIRNNITNDDPVIISFYLKSMRGTYMAHATRSSWTARTC